MGAAPDPGCPGLQRTEFVNDVLTIVCFLAATTAYVVLPVSEITAQHAGDIVDWVNFGVSCMSFAAALFTLAFILARATSGQGGEEKQTDGAINRNVRNELLLLFLFLLMWAFYALMLTDSWNIKHENAFAKAMGSQRPVYTTRYVEWALGPAILTEVGTNQAPKDLLGVVPCLLTRPSSRLVIGYVFAAWVALRVLDPRVSAGLIFLSFFCWAACFTEQLLEARTVWSSRGSARTRAMGQVVTGAIYAVYGVVYLAAGFDLVTPTFEQVFFSSGDMVCKLIAGIALVVAVWQEHYVVVHDLRRSAETISEDLRAMIATSNVPIFGIDGKGIINEWNDKAASVFTTPVYMAVDHPAETVLGEALKIIWTKMKECVETGTPASFEVDTVYKPAMSQEKCHLMMVISCTPRRNNEGTVNGAVCMCHDLSEVAAVKEAESRKTRFLAVVSHELRSPLHGIIGLSDTLKSKETDDVKQKQLTMVNNCACRLLDLVVNIMDMTCMMSNPMDKEKSKAHNKVQLSRDPVELYKVVEEVVLLARSATDKQGRGLLKKSVELINNVDPNLPVIEADAHKCTQMLYNLVTNACKFTKKGTIKVYSKVSSNGDFISISVEDTGKGIAPDALQRIFKPFEQEDCTEERVFEGIGLGLSISKELCERHGGTIKVKSDLGIGTTFDLLLPTEMPRGPGDSSVTCSQGATFSALPPYERQSTDENFQRSGGCGRQESWDNIGELPDTRKCESRKGTLNRLPKICNASRALLELDNGPSPRVLVLSVDDDNVNQAVIQSALGEIYEVHCVYSGTECLQYLSTHSRIPDVILLDVMMPGMNGFEVAKKIRDELGYSTATLPILMLSARSPVSKSLVMGLAHGCNDYVPKPFEKEVLTARVKTVLQIKRLHEVEIEHARHTQLLYSIMPPHIIQRLNAGERMIAESHDQVTILFSDIVGWTNIAEAISTSQVVILLNELFSAFDSLTEKHGVYKVETIGDAYMCAAGHDGKPDHATNIVQFAIAMIEAAKHVTIPHPDMRLQIRVGAHTGPAFSGVVGRKVPRYCFFGDTVNVSSRMESHGAPGCVHVSQSTHDSFNHDVAISLGAEIIDRGNVQIKGKGNMTTHLILPKGTPKPSLPKQKQDVAALCVFDVPDSVPLTPRQLSDLGRGAPSAKTDTTSGSPAEFRRELEKTSQKAENAAEKKFEQQMEKRRLMMEEDMQGMQAQFHQEKRELIEEHSRALKASNSELEQCKKLRDELQERLWAAEKEAELIRSIQTQALQERMSEASVCKQLRTNLSEAEASMAREVGTHKALVRQHEAAAARSRDELAESRKACQEAEQSAEKLEAQLQANQKAANTQCRSSFPRARAGDAMDSSCTQEASHCGHWASLGQYMSPRLQHSRSLMQELKIPRAEQPCDSEERSKIFMEETVCEATQALLHKEKECQHLRLELDLVNQRLSTTRAALADKAMEVDDIDMKLRHALLDLGMMHS